MEKNRFILLTILVSTILFSTLTATPTKRVVLFRDNSWGNRHIEKQIEKYLGEFVTIERENATASAGLLRKTLSTNPDMVIFLDPTTTNTYYTYQYHRRDNNIPSIVLATPANFEKYREGIKNASVVNYETALYSLATTIFPNIPAVNVIYTSNTKENIAHQIALCKEKGVTASSYLISGDADAVMFRDILNQIASSPKTLLWITGSRTFSSLLSSNEELREQIAKKAVAVMTEDKNIAQTLKSDVPVFVTQSDYDMVAAYVVSQIASTIKTPSAINKDKDLAATTVTMYREDKSKTRRPLNRQSVLGTASHTVSLLKKSDTPEKVEVAEAAVETTTTPVAADTAIKESSKVDSTPVLAATTPTPKEAAPTAKPKVTSKPQKVTIKAPEEPSKRETLTPVRPKTKEVTTIKVVKKEYKTINITAPLANVYNEIDPELILGGVAKHGESFPALDTVGEYFKIKAWGRELYVAISDATPITITKEVEEEVTEEVPIPVYIYYLQDRRIQATIIGTIILVILILVVKSILKGKKEIQKLYTRSCLLLSKESSIKVEHEEENEKLSLSRYMIKHKADVIPVSSVKKLQKYMAHHLPDIIVVDWEINHAVASVIREELTHYRLASVTTVIFYNISTEDQKNLEKDFGEAEALFFDHVPTSEELDNALKEESYEDKVEEANELAGSITNGRLFAALQKLEEKRRTGCLVVEDQNPFSAIFFRNGSIVFAGTRDGAVERTAIFTTLAMQEGTFHFIVDRTAADETLNLSSKSVINEWNMLYNKKMAAPKVTPPTQTRQILS